MERFQTLSDHLKLWANDDTEKCDVAGTVERLAHGARAIAELLAHGLLAGNLGAQAGADNADGDAQKELDVRANELLIAGLKSASVAVVTSEELPEPLINNPNDSLIVALDPLDGSSNIDTNVSLGTIFSVLQGNGGTALTDILLPGTQQRAAGYVIYGPQTALVMTLGVGTHIFTLDPKSGDYRLTTENVQITPTTKEFAINASNFRHWDEHVRGYVDDCLSGEGGPRAANFNMRWIASLVAECHRILSRGGVFLYPGDNREGYARGRLRLTYEANPIAWLIEQAGGAASTGTERILDIQPTDIHQRVPLIFGSRDEVARIDGYYANLHPLASRSPLFGQRGLFRA
jgi:fructose-1,6-bisphosphatase I